MSGVICFQLGEHPLLLLVKQGFLATNFLSFCLPRNILNSLSFLKDSFAAFRILDWQFFSLNTLNMLSHCFLASVVCNKKSMLILLRLPCKWWVIFLLLLSRFSLCLSISVFLLYVCGSLCIYPSWSSLISWMCGLMVFFFPNNFG